MVGENQDFSKNSNFAVDPSQIRKILSSTEGAELIRLLRRDGGAGVRAAAELLRRGDAEGAKAVLSPLLQDGKSEELARSLGEKL